MISTFSVQPRHENRFPFQEIEASSLLAGPNPAHRLSRRLNAFSPISLTEMERASLMKRADTKFLLNVEALHEILIGLQGTYRILQHQGARLQDYQTVYFDTPDFRFYHDHHRGAADRYKVRSRKYISSHTCFLEVKHKTCHGDTIKHRMNTRQLVTDASELDMVFLRKMCPAATDHLVPTLQSRFQRVTLVNLAACERITIDQGLTFLQNGKNISLPGIAIVEVKQPRRTRETAFWHHLKELSIHPTSFSKYCTGMITTRPWIKQNNFKPLMLRLMRISQGEHYEFVL